MGGVAHRHAGLYDVLAPSPDHRHRDAATSGARHRTSAQKLRRALRLVVLTAAPKESICVLGADAALKWYRGQKAAFCQKIQRKEQTPRGALPQ